jgi:alkylation response protein AidB-like acyl-CoA dehydrogenase
MISKWAAPFSIMKLRDEQIAQMYTAARIQGIYAGTSELQKVAIAKALMS